VRQYLIGTFVSNFLPSTIGGDAAKIYYLGKAHGYRAITASVVLDRLLGLGLAATLATVALWSAPVAHPRYGLARIILSAVSVAFVIAVAVTMVGIGGLPRRLAPLGPRAIALAFRIQRVRQEIATPMRHPGVWLNASMVVGTYFILVTFVYEAFIVLHGLAQPEFLQVLMAVTSMSVLTNLPITLNGLGLREQLHVLLFEPLGVPREVAVAISLLLFGHLLVASLAGGILWSRTRRDAAEPRPDVAAPQPDGWTERTL
jgi:uncharacterized protein (TIRG00374 family)